MRTAPRGGSLPSAMKRRTLLYDARSTSTEKVERGLAVTATNSLSGCDSYSSVLTFGLRSSAAPPVATTIGPLAAVEPYMDDNENPRMRIELAPSAVTTTCSS